VHGVIAGKGAVACDDLADHVAGKAAAGQETRLAREFGPRLGRGTETPLPDGAGAGQFRSGQWPQRGANQVFGKATLAQVVADAGRAEARGALPREPGGKTLVGQQAARLELIERALNVLGIFAGVQQALQAALQFDTAVVAPRQKRDGTLQQAGRLGSSALGRCRRVAGKPGLPPDHDTLAAAPDVAAGADSPVPALRVATPTFSRILFSISSAMGRLARRNSRTLSLPWPMRSPS